MSELDRLAQEYVDQVRCGRHEEARRTLARRDELLLAEVATKGQLATLFGVSPSAVTNWSKRYDHFPAPFTGSGRTARYLRSEVVAWWAARHATLIQQLEVQK